MSTASARRLVVVVGVVAGVALRVGIYATALGRPDSDEVVSGLMVRHLGDTGFPWFVWGQQYGGTAQLVPVAFSMRIFGDGLLGLRLPNLVLAAVNAWLLYRLARRSMDDRWAVLAGLLLWIGPAASVWFGIHEQLFYPPTTTVGLGLLILAAKLVTDDGRWWHAALFGLFTGVGWWTSSNIVYFALPAVTWALVVSWRRLLRPAWVAAAVGAAVVGALPWLVAVVAEDGAPLEATDTFPRIGTFPARVGYLFREALPGALGPRDVLSHDWAWGPIGPALAGALFGLLAIGLWQAVRRRTWDAFAAAWFVVVYAAIGWSPDDPNLRYTYAAAPLLVSLAVRGVAWFAERRPAADGADGADGVHVDDSAEQMERWAARDDRRWLGAALASIVVATSLTTMSMVRLHDLSENGGTVYRVGNVPDLDQVEAVLDEQGITRVWSDYWVAYRLVFETDGRIVSSPAAGIRRFEPYTDELRRTDRTDPIAWVSLEGVQSDALVEAMIGLGVRYRRFDLDHFLVLIPDRPVAPEELPESARRAPQTPRPTL